MKATTTIFRNTLLAMVGPGSEYHSLIISALYGFDLFIVLIGSYLVYKRITRKSVFNICRDDRANYFEKALDAEDIGFYHLDTDAKSIIVSANVCRLLDFAEEDDMLTYENFVEIVAEGYGRQATALFKRTGHAGPDFTIEFQIKLADDTMRWIKITGSYSGKTGRYKTGLCGLVRDITEQKRHSDFQENYRGILGHELKAPISVLKLNLQTLLRYPDTIKRISGNWIEKNVKQIDRINDIIDSASELAQARGKKMKLCRSDFELNLIIEEVIADLKHIYPLADITVCTKGKQLFNGDHVKIALVIRNLLDNAIKYSGIIKPVQIGCSHENGLMRVSILDEGPGIDPVEIPRLFDCKFRSASAASGKTEGSGFGLFLCAQIVRLHGGEIQGRRREKTGSVFTITLPDYTAPVREITTFSHIEEPA